MKELNARFKQLLVAAVLSLGFMGTARTAGAQIVASDDPCLQKSIVHGLSAAIGIVEWSNTAQLGDALLLLRRYAQESDAFVQEAKAQVAAGRSLNARQLARLSDLRDCLPWLLNLISTLDDELKKRNVNIISPTADARRQRAEAEERAAVAKATLEALKNVEAGLQVALKKPR